MKKILLLLFVCILLTSCQTKKQPETLSTLSMNEDSNETVLSTNTEMSLTLNEAVEIALEEALKWNKEARLYVGISVDKDEEQTGCVLQSKTLELCKQQFRMLQLDMEPL